MKDLGIEKMTFKKLVKMAAEIILPFTQIKYFTK